MEESNAHGQGDDDNGRADVVPVVTNQRASLNAGDQDRWTRVPHHSPVHLSRKSPGCHQCHDEVRSSIAKRFIEGSFGMSECFTHKGLLCSCNDDLITGTSFD